MDEITTKVDFSVPVSTSTTGGIQVGPECARERYWHEMNAEQKCVKLGEAVEYLTREVHELRQQADDFKSHVHSDNQILIPFDAKSKEKNESYFFHNPLGRNEKNYV